jgi:hypothetical protein
VGKPEGRRPLERPTMDGRIILNCILEKWDGGMVWRPLPHGVFLAREAETCSIEIIVCSIVRKVLN